MFAKALLAFLVLPGVVAQPDAEGDGHADGSEVSVPEAGREVALFEVVE